MTAKMTRNILLMLVATVLMGIVLNLYIYNTGTVPAADNAAFGKSDLFCLLQKQNQPSPQAWLV